MFLKQQGVTYQGFTYLGAKGLKMITLSIIKKMHSDAKENMDIFLFEKFLSFFKRLVIGCISHCNQHFK